MLNFWSSQCSRLLWLCTKWRKKNNNNVVPSILMKFWTRKKNLDHLDLIKREKTLILLPMHFSRGSIRETKQTLAMFVYQPCQQRHLHYHWWETDQGSQRECFQGKLSQTGHFYLDFFGVWAWVRSQQIGQSCLKSKG